MIEAVPEVQSAEPCVLVIFGASGDLAQRKLIPALYNLHRNGFLTERFAVVGVSGSVLTDEQSLLRVEASVRSHCADCTDLAFTSSCAHRLHYVAGRIEAAETYTRLEQRLDSVHAEHGTRGNTVVYLAAPADHFATIAEGLRAAGLGLARSDGAGWTRLIVEKPFGRDLESAHELNRRLLACFDGSEIYRIDHYLGKETVQNLLAFRFFNGIFEPIWHRNYADHVQITVAGMPGMENADATMTLRARCATSCRTMSSRCCARSRWSLRRRSRTKRSEISACPRATLRA